MSYLEYRMKSVPTGWKKLLHLHWPLILILTAIAAIGFMMLYSVAGGSFTPWSEAQIQRFGIGIAAMMIVAMTPIWFWRNMSVLAFVFSLALLVFVDSSVRPAWGRSDGLILGLCGCSLRKWQKLLW